jgi:hypothetical protein
MKTPTFGLAFFWTGFYDCVVIEGAFAIRLAPARHHISIKHFGPL